MASFFSRFRFGWNIGRGAESGESVPAPAEPWVVVAEFGAVLEADFAAATLQEAGIPARVTGAHLGIFGAGYQGYSMHGVKVMVPWHREDDARHVLKGIAPDDDDEEPEEPA